MKIRTKLIISFCMIITIPITLALCTLIGFRNMQTKNLETQGIKGAENFSFLTNYVQLLDNVAEHEFSQIRTVADQSPYQLTDTAYLVSANKDLSNGAYLIVLEDGQAIFEGSADCTPDFISDITGQLEKYIESSETQNDKRNTFADDKNGVLVKYCFFKSKTGKQGIVFDILPTQDVLEGVKSVFIKTATIIIVILFLTAMLMIIWIYQSIVAPLSNLQAAAENIKEGNLDFHIEAEGKDEISDLCVTFEEMRQRLKDNAEEKLVTEKENRALISNIAHDLKTPITAVKGYSEGIIDGVANTPEKIDKYVRTIYNKANEMDTLINELTLYTKFDTNRIPYNYAKLNVDSYFGDCIEEIGMDLESKHIGLAYYNYTEKDVTIIADAEQLRRVINNIISNSVKYMDRQAGFVNVRIKDVGDFIQVEIEDNGKGIAQKDLPYIFDRFFRADASRNSATGGSGIGLSIVKKIIEDHGGKIWATSKVGAGTTMYFVIRKFQEVINE